MKNYFVSTAKSLLNQEVIWKLLKDQYWSKDVPIEYVGRFIEHSLCFGAYKDRTNEQIGFARVISDYTTYAYMCDVVVTKEHQDQGVGTLLIDTALQHQDLQGLKTWSLRSTEASRKLYEIRGFKMAEQPGSILEIDDVKIYTRPNFQNLHEATKKAKSIFRVK